MMVSLSTKRRSPGSPEVSSRHQHRFLRDLFVGTPDANVSDFVALEIAEEGLENGHFAP
jgi:hypothetical protein